MTRLWQLLLTLLLAARSSATCCYNHKWMCFGTGVNCDPNCSDGVSKCNLSSEVCLNDSWGGCLAILFATQTVIADEARVTKYLYTTTATSINSTQTLWITQTTTATRDTVTVTAAAQTSPQPTPPATQPSSTPTANGAPFLHKRGGILIQPTSTIINTITDPAFCTAPPSTVIKALVDACTTTITTASTRSVTTSITQTTEMVVNATATITVLQPTQTGVKKGAATSLKVSSWHSWRVAMLLVGCGVLGLV